MNALPNRTVGGHSLIGGRDGGADAAGVITDHGVQHRRHERTEHRLVSNRGSLPHVLGGDVSEGGGGRVLSIPEWLTSDTTRLPTEQEIEPWFCAICDLWDDSTLYQSVAARARAIAEERYSEAVSRQKHVHYFTSLTPGSTV